VLITEARRSDVKMAAAFPLNPGSIVVMDRGYNDYALFGKWTDEGIYFVTRLKEHAAYEVLEEGPLPATAPPEASSNQTRPVHRERPVYWGWGVSDVPITEDWGARKSHRAAAEPHQRPGCIPV